MPQQIISKKTLVCLPADYHFHHKR